jgi:flagellar protein FlbD
MIVLTTPSGKRFAVNPDLIRRIDASDQSAPAVVTLVDGVTYVVAETMDVVMDRMLAHRIAIVSGDPAPAPRLHLVD